MEAPGVPEYLAAMLASFTRVESYVRPVRVRRGVWRKVRYNDMDVDSLLRFCAEADEQQRLRFYKRIADVCLFVTGIFRDYAPSGVHGCVRSPPGATESRGLRDRGTPVLRPRRRSSRSARPRVVGGFRPAAGALHVGPQATGLHRVAVPALAPPPALRRAGVGRPRRFPNQVPPFGVAFGSLRGRRPGGYSSFRKWICRASSSKPIDV